MLLQYAVRLAAVHALSLVAKELANLIMDPPPPGMIRSYLYFKIIPFPKLDSKTSLRKFSKVYFLANQVILMYYKLLVLLESTSVIQENNVKY